jgi:hypothetical protein
MKIKRLEYNPIIHPGLCPSIGTNINGPTLVRVPEWVSNPLGGNCPIEPSLFGPADEPKRRLRDPAFFNEDGKTWLLYSVAGEAGIAIAEIQY